jgi:uncharacterized membrane protein
VLLIASLCFNVALVALIAIAMIRFGGHHNELHSHRRELGPQAIARMVPAERDRIQPIIDAHRPRLRALRAAAMQAREHSLQLLGASDFNAAEFAKSLAAVEAADTAFQAEIVSATSESVAVLTKEERQTLAQNVRKPGRSLLKRMIRRH